MNHQRFLWLPLVALLLVACPDNGPVDPEVKVTIDPTTVTVTPGGTVEFTASVENAEDESVDWSAENGSITDGGVYTAPDSEGSDTVTATSTEDSGKSDTAEVTIEDSDENTSPTTTGLPDIEVVEGADDLTIDLTQSFDDEEDGPSNLTFKASSANDSVVTAAVAGTDLTLGYGSAGTTTVSVTATDSGNSSVTDEFEVTIEKTAGVTVGTDKPTYGIGDEITLTASVDEDGFIYLFVTTPNNPKDSLIQVVPNRFDSAGQGNAIEGGTSRQFPRASAPYTFNTEAPVGTRSIIAVWTRSQIDTSTLVDYENDPNFAGSSFSLEAFIAALNDLLDELPGNDSGVDIQEFEVVE